MKNVLEAAGKSIWQEVRELALKKGTETFVAEGIKSIVEIVKRRRIRLDEYEFGEWKKAQNPDDEEKAAKPKSAKTGDDAKDGEAADNQPGKPAPDEPAPDDSDSDS